MKSVDDSVADKIEDAKAGVILFVEDVLALGSDAVHTALYPLVKAKKISRLSSGIYSKPTYSKLLDQETLPSAEGIALAPQWAAEIMTNPCK